MIDSYSFELNLKIGIVKELYKRGLISIFQMKRVLKILSEQDDEKILKGANER